MFSSNTNTGFGNFGAQQTQQPTNAGLFGQPTNTPVFGTSFGTPAAAPGTLFGQSTVPGTSGAFGQVSTPGSTLFSGTGGISASTPGFTFGQPQTSTSTGFGSTGLFGASTAQTTSTPGFNFAGSSGTTGILFSGGGGFSAAAVPVGTTVKFLPLAGTDTVLKNGQTQNIQTKHQCITSMKEYESKSIEELRYDDYAANRKGSTSLFGATSAVSAPASSGFSFGTAQVKPFGAAAPFQASSGGLFGTTNTATSGLFGAQKPAFGAAAATTASGFTFGSTPASTSGGLFGQTKPLFGAPTATSTPGGLFGATPLFGAKTTAASTGFSFGTSAPSAVGGSTLFGATSKPATGFAFGQPSTSFGATGFGQTGTTSLFGTAATANKGLSFGQQPAQTSSFGGFNFGTATTSAAPAFGAAGSIFGAAQPAKPAFNFGAPSGGSFFGGGLATGQSQPTGLLPQQQVMLGTNEAQASANLHNQILSLALNPYGDSPLFRNLKQDAAKREEMLKPVSVAAQRSMLGNIISPVPKLPRRVPVVNAGRGVLFDELDGRGEEEPFYNQTFLPRKSYKKLVLKNKDSVNPPTRSWSYPTIRTELKEDEDLVTGVSNSTVCVNLKRCEQDTSMIQPSQLINKLATPIGSSTRIESQDSLSDSAKESNSFKDLQSSQMSLTSSKKSVKFQMSDEADSTSSFAALDETVNSPTFVRKPNKCGIMLSRSDYYTDPDVMSLELDDDGRCLVDGFIVGRHGFGSVFYPGITDITGLNLDEVVHFRRKEITIYPDDDSKPPVGRGLNKKAEVTLHCCWPRDKTTKTIIKDPYRLACMKYIDKIEAASVKIGAKFVDYRSENGSWVFEVDHFSKYGLQDSDDEDAQVDSLAKKQKLDSEAVVKVQKLEKSMNGAVVASTPLPVQVVPTIQTAGLGGFDDAEMTEDAKQVLAKPAESFTLFDTDHHAFHVMKASFFASDMDGSDKSLNIPAIPTERVSAVNRSLFSTAGDVSRYKNLFENHSWGKALKETRDLATSSLALKIGYPDPSTDKDYFRVSAPLFPSDDYADDEVATREWKPPQPPATWDTPRPAVVRNSLRRTALADSVANGRTGMIADLGLFFGYSFRASFGPRLTVVRPSPLRGATAAQPSVYTRANTDQFTVDIDQALDTPLDPETMTRTVELALRHSTRCDGGHLKYVRTLDLVHELSDVTPASPLKDALSLCVALWGKTPCTLGSDTYTSQKYRRGALASWLEMSSRATVNQELQDSEMEESGHLHGILGLLTNNQVEEACSLCQDHGYHHLALAISSGSASFILDQLLEWKKTGADRFISEPMMKIYCLLAGELLWHSSRGAINVCSGLDWRRAFSCHFWYKTAAPCSVAQSLHAYASSFQLSSPRPYSRPPLPGYSPMECPVYDTCYHLLQLYSSRTYNLVEVVESRGLTGDLLDSSGSWILCRVLLSLGFTQLDRSLCDKVTADFACQLETAGSWHLATCVLQWLQLRPCRDLALEGVLSRNCEAGPLTEEELYTTEKGGVPLALVHRAKAARALYLKLYRQAVDHFLAAKEYVDAHDVLIEHLVFNAIIEYNTEYIKKVLEVLDRESGACIVDWDVNGRFFLDYLRLTDLLKADADDDAIIEAYYLALDIASRVSRLPSCSTLLERVCRAEIAKTTANSIECLPQVDCVAKMANQDASLNTAAMAIQGLSLPEDVCLSQLCQISTACIRQLCL